MNLAVGYRHVAEGERFSASVLSCPAVNEVYFPWVDEPSGRPKVGFGEGDDAETVCDVLHDELLALKAGGIRLDLLLNANCYGAEAMSAGLEAHLIDIVATLIAWGTKPDVVTAASPFVARTLKRVFPEIEVRASVNMRLTTVQAMDYLSPWFDSYYLGRDVQRNLDSVRRVADWCHARGKKLGILANSGCLRNCPWQTYHDNLIAHSDEAQGRVPAMDFNPHLCWTLYRDRANLAEILKATWIRPEDLSRYEGIVDFVKLATRQHVSPRLVMEAYARGEYRGNLLDLLEPGFSPAFRPQVIDNSSFPDDWFDRSGACSRECTFCGYCEQVFEKVVKGLPERLSPRNRTWSEA